MEFRIYCESIEQGIDFQEYVQAYLDDACIKCDISIIYATKINNEMESSDSLLSRIRRVKDVDITLTIVHNNNEIPLLLVEYSTAFPTDDHIMQRTDLMFWASLFQIPVLKIAPKNKGLTSKKNNGGGTLITQDFLMRMAKQIQLVYYHLDWETNIDGRIITQLNRISCIPKNNSIQTIVNEIIHFYLQFENNFYTNLLVRYSDTITSSAITANELKNIFHNSSRIQWHGDTVQIKINRFGHAMDPDRGILYFFSQLIGSSNVIVEFQMQRSSINERQGYKSLYDGLSQQDRILKEISEIYKTKNGNLSTEKMLNFFFTATNSNNHFTNYTQQGSQIKLNDNELFDYLLKSKGIAYKSLFLMSHKIILSDVSRNTKAEIVWNHSICTKYVENMVVKKYKPLKYTPISNKLLSEDIITYVSNYALQSLQFDILALSYPGAQGDQCILIGNGRNTQRIYLDLIAIKKSPHNSLYLQENKSHLSKSLQDIEKLTAITTDQVKYEALLVLINNILGTTNYTPTKIFIGIGGYNDFSTILNYSKIDYMLMINFENNIPNNTIAHWQLAILNLNLIHEFTNFKDQRIEGTIILPKLYKI